MSAAKPLIPNKKTDDVILRLSAGKEKTDDLPLSEAVPNGADFFGKRSISVDTRTDIFDTLEYQVLKPTQTVKDSSFTVKTIKGKELCFGTYANRAPGDEVLATSDNDGTDETKGIGAVMGSGVVKYNDKMIKVRMLEVNAADNEEIAIARGDLIAAKGIGLSQMKGKAIPAETSFRINLAVSALEINAMKSGPKVYIMRDGKPKATVENQLYELEPNDIVISIAPVLVDILTHKVGEELLSPEDRKVEIPLSKILKDLIRKSIHNGEFDAMDFGIQLTEILRENKVPNDVSDKIMAGAFFAYQIR